jgi:hypothetical protein
MRSRASEAVQRQRRSEDRRRRPRNRGSDPDRFPTAERAALHGRSRAAVRSPSRHSPARAALRRQGWHRCRPQSPQRARDETSVEVTQSPRTAANRPRAQLPRARLGQNGEQRQRGSASGLAAIRGVSGKCNQALMPAAQFENDMTTIIPFPQQSAKMPVSSDIRAGSARDGLPENEMMPLCTQRARLLAALRRHEADWRGRLVAKRLADCVRCPCNSAACPVCRAINGRRLKQACLALCATGSKAWMVSGMWALPFADLEQIRHFDIRKFKRELAKFFRNAGHAKRPWRGRLQLVSVFNEDEDENLIEVSNHFCGVRLVGVTTTIIKKNLNRGFAKAEEQCKLLRPRDLVAQPFVPEALEGSDASWRHPAWDEPATIHPDGWKVEAAIACGVGLLACKDMFLAAHGAPPQ